jgi:hypothetical protein
LGTFDEGAGKFLARGEAQPTFEEILKTWIGPGALVVTPCGVENAPESF